MGDGGGLIRPDVNEGDAARIAFECYGIEAVASELGSNQDRNFLLTEPDGTRSVLRIDNPACSDAARAAQHSALAAYQAAGVAAAQMLPGLDGEITQRWRGFAARRSQFAVGESMLDCGYLAPVVIEEFGAFAAASVNALAALEHPGLREPSRWDMRVAYEETLRLSAAIEDETLRLEVLDAANAAHEALAPVAAALAVQAIHGDLTDDNVMGVPGSDARLHPHTLLDLGDLSYGWRVAELAVTMSSLLHHEPERPLTVLRAARAFHRGAGLSAVEARALWPLVMLRAALLVASGWRQLQIDGENEYARDRIAGEQAIFDAATRYSLTEMTEQVLWALGYATVDEAGSALGGEPEPAVAGAWTTPLRALLPWIEGEVAVLDPGVESESLTAGQWLEADAEEQLVADAFAARCSAAVLPYGVYRLTAAAIDSADAAATWPADTEIFVAPAATPAAESHRTVHAPLPGTVVGVVGTSVVLEVSNGWLLRIAGLRASDEFGTAPGVEVGVGEPLGVLATDGHLVVGLRRSDAPQEIQCATPASLSVEGVPVAPLMLIPERVGVWRRFSHDPAAILGIETRVQRDESGDEQRRREQVFASAQERYYEKPMQIECGWRHHLIDTTGRTYVDMVNNVAGLGHGHPAVADAVNRQLRLLNTNSRFLYRELAEYSERLLALLPERSGLDTVLLVNSGSEAVDLALRLAQAATGRRTVIALREAYHGWTMASDAVTTSAFDNPYALESRPDWVHVAEVPNRFRGRYRGSAADLAVGTAYAADLSADLQLLASEQRPVAGFICESVLGNAGGVLLPAGYLRQAYQRVRAAGGLCIADEVQVGFGRMGSTFWGFEQSGVVPDIITIAKPMGNGFPIGGVITSKRIADALAMQGQFFSSAGGNPVSCRVGMAVLDAMHDERLQSNAAVIGARLRAAFTRLSERHELIGPVHGEGLYLGVELVRDRVTMQPAAAEAQAICERLRELGVIVLTTSERSNVLKVKPPLCLSAASADFVVAQLDRVLTEGW